MIEVNALRKRHEEMQAERDQLDVLMEELGRCAPWLIAAMDHGVDSTHTINDIAMGVVEGRFQFWPAEDAAIITEILHYPQARHVHGFLAGGNMETIKAMIPQIEEWGKEQGCSAATICGRPGWEKALADQGYKKALTTVAKVFDTLDDSG